MAETTITSPPHEEHQYLNLIREVLANGEHRPDRYEAAGTLCQSTKITSGQAQAHYLNLLLLRFGSP